jgi:hypothetical protein
MGQNPASEMIAKMVKSYAEEILEKGGALPKDYLQDAYNMQVAKLQERWRKLV